VIDFPVMLLTRLTFISTLIFWVSACVPVLSGAGPGFSLDQAVDAQFHLHQLSHVTISPDGAYAGWEQSREDPVTGAATLSIFTMDLSKPGAAGKRVTAGDGTTEFHEREAVWSPDGKSLAFLSDAEGSTQVYVADVTGGRARKLTTLTGALAGPSWSLDGKTLAVLFTENAPRRQVPLSLFRPRRAWSASEFTISVSLPLTFLQAGCRGHFTFQFVELESGPQRGLPDHRTPRY
jgi:WD40 repeat protein